MSQIVKAFTGVFIVMFLMATSVSVLSAFFQTMEAQNLHSKVIDELENSDYALTVLEESFRTVERKGASLEVLLYMENGASVVCGNVSALPQMLGRVDMAEVIVTYPVSMPFIGIQRDYQLAGYAR